MMGSTHRSLHIPALEPQPENPGHAGKVTRVSPGKYPKSRKAAVQSTVHSAPAILSPACIALNAARTAQVEAKTISKEVRQVLTGYNRHGALMIARGAAKRFIEAIDILIKAEEEG